MKRGHLKILEAEFVWLYLFSTLVNLRNWTRNLLTCEWRYVREGRSRWGGVENIRKQKLNELVFETIQLQLNFP
jgi:hypothetical protein